MNYQILFCIIALFSTAFAAPTQWRTLEPGLQYTQVYQTPGFPIGAIHAFKINLKKYRLDLVFTKNYERPLILVKDLVETQEALLGINGGFFSPNLIALGLRIIDGEQISPLKHISWWGVFYIKNNRPYIVSQRDFKKSSRISFAVQSGPRLVINGRIPSLKPGWSFRSALGITKKGEVIIAITNRLPITTNTFANILRTSMKDGGLACTNALNLDGGSSSQLYAEIGGFHLNIPSLAPISDAILVFPK
jgi:uncharacterized protein YigE (DUF2233 family)